MRSQTGLFLLSAADYPTMPAEKVLEELAGSDVDALLDYREVPKLSNLRHKITWQASISKYSVSLISSDFNPPYPAPDNPALEHFVLAQNLELAWRRYIALNVWCPIIRSGPRIGRYMVYLPFEDRRSPFAPDFKCLYGDQWFAGNHKVAEILLTLPIGTCVFVGIFAFGTSPDECYYQTVLGNVPGLKNIKSNETFCRLV